MNYKLLEKQDLELMLDFVDDENTQFTTKDLNSFIEEENTYGFIAKMDNKIVGFAVSYMLLKPDGKKTLYLDAIDILHEYQNNGYGTELISFICGFGKSLGCNEMCLITNRSNKEACKCYEKAGGLSKANDDVVYVFDLNIQEAD